MAKVVATSRGYYGRVLREPGDIFDAEGEASWWTPYKASAEPVADADKPAKAKPGPKPKPAPFADAPEPVRVQNEINTALGTAEPDWVMPARDDI
jgi:hypothetical protein